MREQVITQEKTIADLQEQVAKMETALEGRITDTGTSTATPLQGEIAEMKANYKAIVAEQKKFKYALDAVSVLETQMADLKRIVENNSDDRIAGTTANKVLELDAEIAEVREQANGNWEKLGETIKGFQK